MLTQSTPIYPRQGKVLGTCYTIPDWYWLKQAVTHCDSRFSQVKRSAEVGTDISIITVLKGTIA